ncbi:NRDE-2, necessary for RNA interference domain containing protein [Naviculisporaceae sp. PSN 640]
MAPGEEKEKRRAVPKFTSFKPPAPVTAEAETRPADSREAQKGKGDEKDVGSSSEKKHRHSSKRQRDEEGRETHGRERDRKFQPSSHSDRPPREVNILRDSHHKPAAAVSSSGGGSGSGSGNDLFFFDKRGDPLIAKYGGNDRYRVPEYHRFGGGRLLGSDGILSVHYAGSRQLFDIEEKRHHESKSVFRDKVAMARAANWKTKRITSAVPDPFRPTNDDYIEVEPPKKRHKGEGKDLWSLSKPDYRSIHGKAKAGQHSESEDESNDNLESEDESGPAEISAIKQRSIEINRHLKESPADINSWLELIKLQDGLFRENEGIADVRSADSVRALADLKLSLYEEALVHATSSSDREKVLDGLMREGAKIWSPKALAKRWDEVFKKETESFTLWRARLNFELGQVSTCTYEEIKKFITEKIRTLNKKLSNASNDDLHPLSSQLIYVFLRLTRFLHDTGYTELAVAAWQATLELNLFRPPNEQDFETALSSFADYWETEAPRIGEDGWKGGWKCFVESASIEDLPEGKSDIPFEVIQSRDVFKAWAAAELQGAQRARMPARTLDENTVDDPFKVVMFSDIRDLLIWIPDQAQQIARTKLLDAFLVFCRLPTTGLSRNDDEFSRSLQDPFIASRDVASEAAFNQRGGIRDEVVDQESKKNPQFRQQGANIALSQDVLFAGPNWFQYLSDWSSTDSLGFDDRIEPSWVLGALREIVRQHGSDELAEYYLALEWRNDSSKARRVAKSLLKESPTNTRLYNAYALTERGNQNVEMLEKVLSSATGRNLPGEQRLWNTWAWFHLESNQNQMALLRLCASVDDTIKAEQAGNISPITLLRTRTRLSSIQDYSLSSRDLPKAIQHAESLALFEYLAGDDPSGGIVSHSQSQGNITAAMSSIWTFCDELKSLSSASYYFECLLQTASRLLFYHATHGAYRPAYLRAELTKLVEAIPTNAIFLELLAWANQSTLFLLVNDPIRDIILRQTSDDIENDVARHLAMHRFAIRYEAARGVSAGATMMYPAKAAFEAALGINSPCGGELRGNVDLWVCYIRLLQHIYRSAVTTGLASTSSSKGKGSKDPESNPLVKNIKEVYYRAIAACPWSKRLYMEAFGEGMIKLMGSGELKGVVNTMVEKGLRVCVEMEGFFDKWAEERKR